MPFKATADRRHRIPKQRHRVTNRAAYDAALRQRGSLTVWFTEEAVAAWRGGARPRPGGPAPRTTRGGQPWYSPLAILTALTLRAVFRLAFRQTEGLIGSVVGLLGLALRVPDHTTLSRRAATLEVPRLPRSGGSDAEPVHLLVDSTGLKLCGPGEWLVEKHGTRTRRSWRKLVWGSRCQAFIAGTPCHPSVPPDTPKGRDRGEELEQSPNAAQAALEERGQAAGELSRASLDGFFSAGRGGPAASDMPAASAQGSASALPTRRGAVCAGRPVG